MKSLSVILISAGCLLTNAAMAAIHTCPTPAAVADAFKKDYQRGKTTIVDGEISFTVNHEIKPEVNVVLKFDKVQIRKGDNKSYLNCDYSSVEGWRKGMTMAALIETSITPQNWDVECNKDIASCKFEVKK